MNDWQKKIDNIVISLPEEYYANDSDIAFLTKYDVCVPGGEMNLSNEFIRDLWSNIFNSFEYFNDEEAEISILSSNTGARVLEKAPKNSLITSFNTDYTCKVITDLVCQDKAEEGNYFSYMRDISQYFAVKNTNSSKKYDIVIVQSGSQFYKGIDYDDELNLVSSCQYYATRGYHFVGNNGLLVVICTKSEVDDVVNRLVQIEGLDITKYVKSDNVVGIIIEKTDKYEDIEMRMGEGDGAYPNIFHEKRKIQK